MGQAARHTHRVPARSIPAATLLTLIALLMSACGGDSDDPETTTAPAEETTETDRRTDTADADAEDVEVIDAWAKALARGRRRGARPSTSRSRSTAENGPTLRISSRGDARLFNASLPCGAVLVGAETQGDFTTATFELTERPGPGTCGDGVGSEAQTTFVIEDGKIVEWRRVATLPGREPAPGRGRLSRVGVSPCGARP